MTAGIYSNDIILYSPSGMFQKKIILKIAPPYTKMFSLLYEDIAYAGTSEGRIKLGCSPKLIEGEYLI